MEKAKKSEFIGEIKDLMNGSNAMYLIDFSKMTVAEVNELRTEFYNAGLKYRVVKNTLALWALKETDNYSAFAGELESFLKGPTGIVFAYDDPVTAAKILKKNNEKIGKPKFKTALLDGTVYGSDKLNELASLLTKDELIASICGSLNSPASGIVGAVNALMRDLASIIEEVARKNAA